MNIKKVTIVYLALPWVIFFAGWLNLFAALPALALLGFAVYQALKQAEQANSQMLSLRALIFIAGLSLVWTAVSGFAGVGHVNLGAQTGQMFLSKLVSQQWPIEIIGAFGAFLPAAAIGKISNWNAACWIFYGYISLGVFLSLSWFVRLSRGAAYWLAPLFIFLGGLDAVGFTLFKGHYPAGTMHLEAWSWPWTFFSNTALLFWAAPQAIAAWLGAAIVLSNEGPRAGLRNSILVVALIMLWSPAVATGLLFVAACDSYRVHSWSLGGARGWVAIFLMMIAGGYYFSSKWVWASYLTQGYDFAYLWPRLLFAYILEFGIFMVVSEASLRKAALPLIVLPLFCVPFAGMFPGVLAPAQFIFWVSLMRGLKTKTASLNLKLIWLSIFLGSASALSEISRSLTDFRTGFPDLSAAQTAVFRPQQPMVRRDSFFFKHLTRPLPPLFMNKYGSPQHVLVRIEAESFNNKPRKDHLQDNPITGEKIIGNDFGAEPGDFVSYAFSTPIPAAKAVLDIYASTQRDGAELTVEMDGKKIGNVTCPETRGWFRFTPFSLVLGALTEGTHQLVVRSNGININLDYFIVSWVDPRFEVVEAENGVAGDLTKYVQGMPLASGGKVIANNFGADRSEPLSFSFALYQELKPATLTVLYATEKLDAGLVVYVDGNLVGNLACPATGDASIYEESTIALPNLAAGPHTLVVASKGVNVNLDRFVIGPAHD